MITARPHCCEEAAMGMGDAYLPCNKPATKIIRPRKDGSEPDLRMCDACADHSVRNRGMLLLGPYAGPSQVEKVEYWTTGYNFWKASQGHEVPPEMLPAQSFEDSPCAGFYRKGVYEKVPNKRSKRVGWEPVAIWRDADGLHALVGNNTADPLNIWTHVCGNPIPEAWYRAVESGQGWPDDHKAGETIRVNVDPSTIEDRNILRIEETPADRIARELKAEQAHLPTYATIDSDEMSSKARSLQNRFLELRGEAKKEYDTLNAPLLKEQNRLREIWFPLRDEADAGSNTLKGAMGAWEDKKRRVARLAQEKADKEARDHAEAVRKAEAANKPAPPPPEPVKPNTPPPSAQIRGGAGRAAAVSVQVFVTAIDEEKVATQFRGNPELVALLTALAQKAIRAGIQVPGATTEERSIVR